MMAAAVVGAIAGIIGVTAVRPRPSVAADPVARLAVPIPPSVALTTAPGTDLVLSPDGRTLVFGNTPSGLFRRSVESFAVEPVRGAENGGSPFFSPDGKWIGFRAARQLRKVPVGGGTPLTICDSADPDTATWGDDDVVIFHHGKDLYKVSANGGSPSVFLRADDQTAFSQPRFIPHSSVLLIQVQRTTAPGFIGAIEAVQIGSGKRHQLIEGNTPQWSPTGDLLFERDNTVWAVPLDLKEFKLHGTPVPVLHSVRRPLVRALYASAGGSLAYLASDRETSRALVWIDRTGKATAASPARDAFQSPRLSPDGARAAISIQSSTGLDLWLHDLERGSRLRLTTSGVNRRAVWSPDGSQITFYSTPSSGGDQDLFVIPAAGGEAKRLLARGGAQYPDSWSPDGRILVFEEPDSAAAGRNLWLLPVGEAPRPLVVTRFNERGAVIAPSGRWFAFVSDESGTSEVYVQAFPGPAAKTPVSINGGVQPVWRRDGRELYYREGDWLMAVSVQLEPFRIGVPQRLFEMPATSYNLDQNFADYDVDGAGRFLAIRNERTDQDQAYIVLNWAEELRRNRISNR
jgi:Tol biopolymer transport system component